MKKDNLNIIEVCEIFKHHPKAEFLDDCQTKWVLNETQHIRMKLGGYDGIIKSFSMLRKFTWLNPPVSAEEVMHTAHNEWQRANPPSTSSSKWEYIANALRKAGLLREVNDA